MATPSTTAKRRLADTLLDEGLDAYVSRHRNAGDSWREISLNLRDEVQLDIHPHTLRLWFHENEAA